MNVYITKLNGLPVEDTSQYIQRMAAEIAHQLGFREMGIYRYNGAGESQESFNGRLDGIIAGIDWGNDVVVCQFPTGNGLKYERGLVRRLKMYQSRVVIFIHALDNLIKVNNSAVLKELVRLYNQAEVLIVPSLMMRQFLLDHGIKKDMKFIIQEMWDCTTDMNFYSSPKFCKEIHFLDRNGFEGMDGWSGILPLKLYGASVNQGQNVHNMGQLSPGELLTVLSKGGFGLEWYHDEEFRWGMEYGISFSVAQYLAAGIPVIVPKGISNQYLIEKNHLGLVVDSLDDAVEQVKNLNEADYQGYVRHIRDFSFLVRGGYFTRKVLIEAVQMLFRKDMTDYGIANTVRGEIEDFSESNKKTVNIMDMQETLEYVKERQISVVRFGDGEINLMTGQSLYYQDYDEELVARLKQVITMPDNEKLLVCLPDIFERRERYTDTVNAFWEEHLRRYQDFYDEVVVCGRKYGSTFLSRPYLDLADKSIAGKHFQNMKDFFADQDILIVEGFFSRSGVGNDLFQRAKSVERIICPSRNAYNKHGMIMDAIRRHGTNKLILLMLGPTAKVIAADLAFEGYWAVDIGHIDSEYEWYKMGATYRIKLKNKHTAEFNTDENIELQQDDIYAGEIVEMLEENFNAV